MSARTATTSRALSRPQKSRLLGNDVWAVAAAIVVVTTGIWVRVGGFSQLIAGGNDTLLALGRLAGMYAALAALGGLLLAARPRSIERKFGLDKMLGWHRVVGITTVFLVTFHAVIDTVAWGIGAHMNPVAALIDLIRTQQWMIAALAALVLFLAIGLSSWRRIRRRIAYETWYFVHLTAYLAVLLAFGHQITLGTDISGRTLALVWWIGLCSATFAWVVMARSGDFIRSLTRGRTVITRLRQEAPGVGSVEIGGPGLRRVRASAGQFFIIRVARRGLWWQPHPFSLSAAPTRDAIRFTIKDLGDGSSDILRTEKGTRVLLEGPYGRFTVDEAEGSRVVLFGGGVGIAPIRALLEDLESHQKPVVILRCKAQDELMHLAEIETLVAARKGTLHVLAGPREWFSAGDPFRPDVLSKAVPDIRERHSFICGPASFEYAIEKSLRALKVPSKQVHRERFGV